MHDKLPMKGAWSGHATPILC